MKSQLLAIKFAFILLLGAGQAALAFSPYDNHGNYGGAYNGDYGGGGGYNLNSLAGGGWGGYPAGHGWHGYGWGFPGYSIPGFIEPFDRPIAQACCGAQVAPVNYCPNIQANMLPCCP